MSPDPDYQIVKSPVAIVGNINLDVKTSLIPASEGILADGETGVAEIYESIGGGGANTAVAATHLGACVHFAGCIGSDELGRRLEASLRGYGIVAHLSRKASVTGRSVSLNWSNGCRHFISSLPNNRLMTIEDIDIGGLIEAGCSMLLRSDVWFSEQMLADGNRVLLERARGAGMETYMDINWDPEWSLAANSSRVAERRAHLMKVLPLVNYAHGNERELGFFTGCNNIHDASRYLLDRGCSEVVIHRGVKGAASFNAAEGWAEVPAREVSSIVSSTGSGDVFCAAHMLLSGLETGKRLRVACAIAADHLSGTHVLIPSLDEPGIAFSGAKPVPAR